MAWRIEKYGSPFSGGWMDWPAGLLMRMNAANNTYFAVSQFLKAAKDGKGTKWGNEHPQLAKIAGEAMALRREHGY